MTKITTYVIRKISYYAAIAEFVTFLIYVLMKPPEFRCPPLNSVLFDEVVIPIGAVSLMVLTISALLLPVPDPDNETKAN